MKIEDWLGWRPLRRLAVQLPLMTALVMTGTLFAYTEYTVREQIELYTDTLLEQARGLAARVAGDAAAALAGGHPHGLEEIVREAARFPQVLEVAVTDAGGRALGLGPGPAGAAPAPPRRPDPAVDIQRGEALLWIPGLPRRATVWQPVEGGTAAAWVRLDYDLTPIAGTVRHIQEDSLLVGLGSVAVGMLLILLVLRRPMAALRRATELAGQLDRRRGEQLPVYRHAEEIRRLDEALNHVSTRLQAGEEALRTTSERLTAILEQAVDGIITIDEQGTVESFNTAAEHIFGYPAAQIIGRDIGLLIPETYRNRHRHAMERALAHPALRVAFRNRELTARRRDGAELPVELSVGEARVGRRRIFVGIVRDISERKLAEKALQESEARKSAILQSALDCIVSMDHKGRIIEFNPAAEKTFGYRRHQVLGRELADVIVPPGLREAHRKGLAHYLGTGEGPVLGKRIEITAMRAGGEEFPIELAITPIRLDTGIVFTAYLRDIAERKRAEDALRDSERRYRLVVDNVKEIIFQTDAGGRWTFLNPAWTEITGFALEDSLGTLFLDYIHPEDRQRNQELFEPLIQRKKEFCRHEVRYLTADGGYRWMEVFAKLTVAAEGHILGATGTLNDITARRAVEEEVRRQQQLITRILDTLPLNIYLKDRDGRFVLFNETACRTTGVSRQQAIGKTDFDIFPAAMASRIRAHDDQVRAGGGLVMREERTLDGGYLLAGKTMIQAHPDRAPLLLGFSLDITERKQAEQALLQAKEAAEAANRSKSDFLANMSHEIRTPMNAIIGMTGLALDTELSPEQREYLSLVKSSADALLAIINEILDFSKIEAGQLAVEAIDFELRSSLREIIKPLAIKAHEKGLEMLYDVAAEAEEFLVGDPGRLRQILVNLVGNAIKFTERGEILVQVAVEKAEALDTVLRFAVRDTGIGIPKDKQGLIFAPFAQADTSTTRRFGGTGLGLTICMRLAEMMGGRLWVDSEPGQGSTFSFTATFQRQQNPPPTLLDLEFRHLPALVVDDNASSRAALVRMLGGWGLCATAVAGIAQALAELEAAARRGRPYRMLLVDAGLPEPDGVRVLERAAGGSGPPPVCILLTSGGGRGEAPDDRDPIPVVLAKPVDSGELLATLQRTLTDRRPPTPGAHPAIAPAAASGGRSLAVLLAEDNPVNQKLAVRLLEKQGHRVTVANHGGEAVELAKQRRFDVIFMDVQMPQMDGFKATRQIRRHEAGRTRTPIVAMTAHAMEGDRERCLAQDMDEYLSKPIKVERLTELLATLPLAQSPRLKPAPAVVVDRKALLSRMDDDPELLQTIVGMFLENAPGHMARLRSALANEEREALRREAHTLSGLLQTLCAVEAGAAAAALEQRVAAEQPAQAALERLEREMERLLPDLQGLQDEAAV